MIRKMRILRIKKENEAQRYVWLDVTRLGLYNILGMYKDTQTRFNYPTIINKSVKGLCEVAAWLGV